MARWMRRALALTVVLAAGAVGAPFALAATNTPPGLLDSAKSHPNDSFAVIVTTSPSSPVDVAGTIVHDDNGNHFGAVNRGLSIVHGAAATVTGQELVGLAAQPGVLSITPDAPVVRDTTAPVPAQEWQTAAGLTNLAPAANAPTIAVVDSGIGHTDALAGRVVGSVNLASDGAQGTNDQYGHGTLVAGIAAGSSAVYPGAAPTARILSLRVIGKDGSARTSDVIAAADWIYANRATYNIRVANFSLHSSQPSPGITDPLDLAVRRLWLTGTVVVAAAGNDGPERMLYAPASDPFVITVGAVGTNGTPDPTDDTVAPWSSNGYTAEGFAKPELAAPGRMLVGPVPNGSTLVQTFPDRVVAPGWMWMSGTSLAAPVVSGIAARLLALHPDWTPDQVKGALLATATHLDDPAAGAG